jgi:drug/metabolite transporter (DMT)-like permease
MTSLTLSPPSQSLSPRVISALLACYLVWGSTYLAIKWALPVFPPFFQMGTRFVTAGVLLLAWVLVRGAALPSRLQWRNALVVGTLMLGGGMGLTAVATQSIGSGLIATFIAVVPMMVSGWGLLLGQRPSKLEFAGMLVGLGGIVLLVQGAGFSASTAGLAAICGATLMWSLGSVLQTTRLMLASGPSGFASEMLCGGAVLLLISTLVGEEFAWPVAYTPEVLRAFAAWAYLVAAGTLIAFSAYLYLLANTRPAIATSYAFVNPVIALLLGMALAAEQVSAQEWLACGVILLGVALILRGKIAAHRA